MSKFQIAEVISLKKIISSHFRRFYCDIIKIIDDVIIVTTCDQFF